MDTECATRTCADGACGASYAAAGKPLAAQAPGDCQRAVCDGQGGITVENDDTDVPDDGNPCTQDACTGGAPTHVPLALGATCGAGLVCAGATCIASCVIDGALHAPGAIDPSNPCQACDPAASTSTWSPRPTGTACDDGNACTQLDTCQSGACVGTAPVVCAALDPCHLTGTCDPATGQCSNPNRPDGAACDDGNACSQLDTCQNGACTGTNPIVCPGGATCVAGTCTGGCATGGTIAWTVAVPAPPTPTPPSWCNGIWFHTQPPFTFEGFAAGPSGDVAFAMQWLGAYTTKCYPPPQVGVYRYDATGAQAAKSVGGSDYHLSLSGLAFDPQGNVLHATSWSVGYCPNWACAGSSIWRRSPNLSTVLFSASDQRRYSNDPPFEAYLMAGTASGELFAGIGMGYPPYYLEDQPIYCGSDVISSSSLIHFGAAGQCLGHTAPISVQAVGALGGLYTSYPFTGTTDAGCGPMTGGAASNTAVVKRSPDGQCVWSRAYPGTVRFALGPAEQLLLATSFSGTIDLGGGPLTSAGTLDLAIAAFDAAGQPMWQKRLGAPGASIAVTTFGADKTGGPAFVGSVSGAVNFGCNQVTSGTLFAAFDAAGNNRYARVHPVTGTYQAAVDGTGGIYLVSTDTSFDVGNGPLLAGPGVAVARVAP